MSTVKSHYDFNSGQNFDHERNKPSYDVMNPGYRGKRFCESCRTMKPKNGKPHVKGWICNDCQNRG